MDLHLKPFCSELQAAFVYYIEDLPDRDNNSDRFQAAGDVLAIVRSKLIPPRLFAPFAALSGTKPP